MPIDPNPMQPAPPPEDVSLANRPEVDPAQESLSQALRTGFNLLRLFMIVLLIAYFASGWFQVGAGEQGLVVRFGHLLENTHHQPDAPIAVFEPGSHPSLPDPFDEKIRISGQLIKTEDSTFLFQRGPDDVGKSIEDIRAEYDSLDPSVHGTMITGDRSLAHGLWRVHYHIADAEKFVRNISDHEGDFEPFLKRLLENAVVRTVAGLPLDRVSIQRTSREATDFTVAVQAHLARDLERFNTGVIVDTVQAEVVQPGTVRDAFLGVTRALAEKESEVSRADQKRVEVLSHTAGTAERYNELLQRIDEYGAAQTAGADEVRLDAMRSEIDAVLDKCGGEVASVLRQAQSRASEILNSAAREHRQFTTLLEQFRKHPREVAIQLWTEMREVVLASKKNELFFVPRSGVIEILTNRDQKRALMREKEALKNKNR